VTFSLNPESGDCVAHRPGALSGHRPRKGIPEAERRGQAATLAPHASAGVGRFGVPRRRWKKNSSSAISSPQGDIASTDQAIDTLVYQLYGLTEAEIQIVESQ
jgi:hypothetical protein